MTVLADNYSTPDHIRFEEELRVDVNRRLKRLGVLTVCRLDSSSTDALQIVDLLTSAVTFEFRQNAGIASRYSSKAKLAEFVRQTYGVPTFLNGCDPPPLNAALYGTKRKRAARGGKKRASAAAGKPTTDSG